MPKQNQENPAPAEAAPAAPALMSAKQVMQSSIIPHAKAAAAWRQSEHEWLVDLIVGLLADGKIGKADAALLLKLTGNISAFRQKLEHDKIIPASEGRAKGRGALSALLAS